VGRSEVRLEEDMHEDYQAGIVCLMVIQIVETGEDDETDGPNDRSNCCAD
jgi:hypothetical protein